MFFFVLIAGFFQTACMKKNVRKTEISPEEPANQALAPVEGSGTSAVELGEEWASIPQLMPVYFDTNKTDLRDDARTALKQNAEVIKAVLRQVPSAQVRIEGHCDERNTLEYNLALGEKRALAIKSFYSALGIGKKTLETISYGEERPVCQELNENCWGRNRRGATTVRSASGPARITMQR
ncbi:MAG: OmpA family protein [Elusimicrobia bacterium]|nr:OmpA family protein [Elusimicrobiota bacterium]